MREQNNATGTPAGQPSRDWPTVTCRYPPHRRKALVALAGLRDMTLSDLVREALDEVLRAHVKAEIGEDAA